MEKYTLLELFFSSSVPEHFMFVENIYPLIQINNNEINFKLILFHNNLLAIIYFFLLILHILIYILFYHYKINKGHRCCCYFIWYLLKYIIIYICICNFSENIYKDINLLVSTLQYFYYCNFMLAVIQYFVYHEG